jgi:chromate transporter
MGFALGALYLQSAKSPVVQNILGGVSAVAAGLLIATGVRLLMPHLNRPVAVLFAALAFAGVVFTKAPLLVVLLGLAPLSIAVAAVERGRAR